MKNERGDEVRILTRTVKNPKPDRRSTDWDKKPEWAKGMRLLLRPGGATTRARFEHLKQGWKRGSAAIYDGEPGYAELMVASVPVEPSVGAAVALYWPNEDLDAVLAELAASGHVTHEHVKAAAEANERREEGAYYGVLRHHGLWE